jgi:hypothetical protein
VGMQPPFGGEEPSGREGLTPGYGGVQSPPFAPGPPPGYVPAGYAPVAPDSSGGLAVAGLIFGIIALLLPVLGMALLLSRLPGLGGLAIVAAVPIGIAGVVLSALGLGSTLHRRSAIAGLILSILGIVFALAVVGRGLLIVHALRMRGPRFRHPFLP